MSAADGPTASDVNVLVVAKSPEPGRTKTRLAASVGPVHAARLSAAAFVDTLRACREAFDVDHCNVSLAGTLDDAVDANWIREELVGWHVRPQHGSTFEDRLARAHAEITGPVVQIGTDTPQVTPELLREAAALLGAADAFLGLAVDGGWWALGLRDPAEARCLRNVAMSTSTTGSDTYEALREAGLSVALASTLRDVDVAEDATAVAEFAPWTEFARRWSLTDVVV
jgi:glycosyltransferase A (GT-A) superfamily protein (DUF2064 family)